MNRAPLLRTCEVAVNTRMGVTRSPRSGLANKPKAKAGSTRPSPVRRLRHSRVGVVPAPALCGLPCALCAGGQGAEAQAARRVWSSGGHRSLTRSIYPRSVAGGSLYSQGTLPHLCRHRVLHTQKGTMSQTRYLRNQLSYKWCSPANSLACARGLWASAHWPLRLYVAWGWLGATRVRSIKKRPVPQLDPSQLAVWPPSLRSVAAPLRWKKGASAFVARARPRRGRAQHLFQKVCSHSEIIFRCTVKSATAPACAWSEVWSSKSHWP